MPGPVYLSVPPAPAGAAQLPGGQQLHAVPPVLRRQWQQGRQVQAGEQVCAAAAATVENRVSGDLREGGAGLQPHGQQRIGLRQGQEHLQPEAREREHKQEEYTQGNFITIIKFFINGNSRKCSNYY